MNAWTERVVVYLEKRREEGDRTASALLARGDAPRPPPEKRANPRLAYVTKRKNREERDEAEAKRAMHDECFAWNLRNTRDTLAPCGRCDCGCGGRFTSPGEGECDHWIERSQGGEHTRANGWRLLARCHHRKTENDPDRPAWNDRRRAYCERAAVPYVERRAR